MPVNTSSLAGRFAIFLFVIVLFIASKANAYSVSELTAVYRNGQVFLTWKNPGTFNLQYNVYRSTSKFTSSTQLNSSTYLGYVRDNSGKNIRKSGLTGQDVYFRIENDGAPLASNRGLYVVTCTDNQPYYYAVSVTNLTINKEVKKIIMGSNSLSNPIIESIADPLPVFQEAVTWSTGEVANEYVQFVNNQETPHYPAMSNKGSYGFNFNVISRGNPVNGPLFVFFEGLNTTAISGSGIEPFDDVTDCTIISVDDWLPDPVNPPADNGYGTFWCCYHENFNPYSKVNPIPTSGVIKTYPQKRFIETIEWAHNALPVDKYRTYLIGLSAGGFGALLTANLIPDKIAAVYAVVEPILLKAMNPGFQQQIWGAPPTDLPTDVLNPQTGEPILIWELLDMKDMLKVNLYESFPLIFSIHGKKDVTTGWTYIPKYMDSADAALHGGVYYWDQRKHDRTNADFLDTETMPDLTIYSTNKSYPAFSDCSINQNPGNGIPTNGDPYGAINGYLTWDNDNITDEKCDYAVNVSIRDFYVGGVLDDEQYNTCTADITFRRLQKFKPQPGETVKWSNFDDYNVKIQNGTITYDGGLITINDLIINKTGNRIELDITNCSKDGLVEETSSYPIITPIRTWNGYELNVEIDHNEKVSLNIYDGLGRVVQHEYVSLQAGSNKVEISQLVKGLYFAELNGNGFTKSVKLLF